MSERENVWLSPDRASGERLFPSPATPGGHLPPPPPVPPNPPDPHPSSLADFPPLSATTTPQKGRSPMQISPPKGTASRPSHSCCSTPTTDASLAQTSQIFAPGSEIYNSIPNVTYSHDPSTQNMQGKQIKCMTTYPYA
ncbi:hypothetical protein F2Q68_00037829 [Brassica cretica]|uniref:Uncharacterized protein n=1 Tax=Brassica cretica TaxID=69181 RepID=A0A8S9GXP5_BRACR|nr:hypothetical protein F2Q68_00037829 [Brassica cretica]